MQSLQTDPSAGSRLNAAYHGNLVYKDATTSPRSADSRFPIDQKRVLDLSPERLDAIAQADPQLLHTLRARAPATLAFWQHLTLDVAPRLIDALQLAVDGGAGEVPPLSADAHFNFRMVDYYPLAPGDSIAGPRCGEHRDYGLFTLIFTQQPGLEVNVDGRWEPLPPCTSDAGAAHLLFGWCTQIRSNGRIRAALHRVSDGGASIDDVVCPRRTSAVLFCAPKHADTSLEPAVRPGEARRYARGIRAGDLRGSMARKWQFREGTLAEEDAVREEAEILATGRTSQDDVVGSTWAM